MSERLTLALDGSTSTCSVALVRVGDVGADGGDATLLSRRSESGGRSQGKALLRLVDEMLEEVSATPAELMQVVVGTGPGTFTGVRIAVATARALAVGLRIPVFGVSTLAALASIGAEDDRGELRADVGSLVPVVDARRNQVFFAVYEATRGEDADQGRRWVRSGPIGVGDSGSLAGSLAQVSAPVVVVGEYAGLVGALPPRVEFTPCEVRAEYLVLGRHWISDEAESDQDTPESDGDERLEGFGSPEEVRPVYVRAPDADMHIKKMKDPWADDDSK